VGTNYYLYENAPCNCCGRPYEELHIGKSSAGWVFSLRVYPEDNITTLEHWKERWSKEGVRIVNEYGDTKTPDEMLSVITQRNHPQGLLRQDPDRFLYGRGEGTWDYIIGEFS
jgi:hypothetical protein